MIDKVFTRLLQKFFKDRRRTMAKSGQCGHICVSHGQKKTKIQKAAFNIVISLN